MPRCNDVRAWHLITGEYPPDLGGVADYTAAVAAALADAGSRVHVWTAGTSGSETGAVSVHRVFGSFGRRDLASAERLFDPSPGRDRVVVQWVPHAFGRRGVNLPFAHWLRGFSMRHRAPLDVMVHEPFVPFAGSAAQHGAALVQRAMTAMVLRAASRAFAGTPAWIDMCRPFARRVPFRWSPIPSGVPDVATAEDAAHFRRAHKVLPDDRVIGVFGRGGVFQERALDALAAAILKHPRDTQLLLIGLGSEGARARLVSGRPAYDSCVRATGTVGSRDLSAAITCCDVMFQPFADGICSRHSSVAALLAHGRPIVTNAGRFTEDFWRAAGIVALAGGSDPDALAVAAMRLVEDRPARLRLSDAARAAYDERFHVRHTVESLQEAGCA